MSHTAEITRITNDVNGNPRYVTHFLNFNSPQEANCIYLSLGDKYDLALQRASMIGGRKFHNKQFGGGIVWQSYNKDADIQQSFANYENYNKDYHKANQLKLWVMNSPTHRAAIIDLFKNTVTVWGRATPLQLVTAYLQENKTGRISANAVYIAAVLCAIQVDAMID